MTMTTTVLFRYDPTELSNDARCGLVERVADVAKQVLDCPAYPVQFQPERTTYGLEGAPAAMHIITGGEDYARSLSGVAAAIRSALNSVLSGEIDQEQISAIPIVINGTAFPAA